METDLQTPGYSIQLGKAFAYLKSKINVSLAFQILVFIFGLALLVFFIYYTGLQTISDAIKKIGWGLLIIFALNGSRHLLRAFSVYLAIPREHRNFGYHNVVATRLCGDAVSILSFMGPLLGETTKATLLKRWIPASQAVAAVLVDNIIYDISVALMILSGASLLFYSYTISDSSVIYGVFGTIIFSVISILGLILMLNRRVKPFTWLIEKFGKNIYFPKVILNKKAKVEEIETNIYQFYLQQRLSFFAIVAINLLAHLLSVSEVFLVLYMLGIEIGFIGAFIIESLTKVINFVFSFVPGTVGVYEGGNGVILHSVGFATANGVILGLIRKGAIMFWTSVGIIILIWKGILYKRIQVTEKP